MKRVFVLLVLISFGVLSYAQNLRFDVYSVVTLDAATNKPLSNATQKFMTAYLKGNILSLEDKKYSLFNKRETTVQFDKYITYDAVDEADQICSVIIHHNSTNNAASDNIMIRYEDSNVIYVFVSNKPVSI